MSIRKAKEEKNINGELDSLPYNLMLSYRDFNSIKSDPNSPNVELRIGK